MLHIAMDLRYIYSGKGCFVQEEGVQAYISTMGSRSQFLILSFRSVPGDWAAVSRGEGHGGGCSELLSQWSSSEICQFCFT